MVSHWPKSPLRSDSNTFVQFGSVTPSRFSKSVIRERAFSWADGSRTYNILAPWSRCGSEFRFFFRKSAFDWLAVTVEYIPSVCRFTTSATGPSNCERCVCSMNRTRHECRSGLLGSNPCARFIDFNISNVRPAGDTCFQMLRNPWNLNEPGIQCSSEVLSPSTLQ